MRKLAAFASYRSGKTLPAGAKPLGLWREVGEWWAGEPMREVSRFIDFKGIRREVERALPTLGLPEVQEPVPSEREDHREEYEVRLRKKRDEKVARACGLVSDPTLVRTAPDAPSMALLHATSGYSFGRSCLRCEEIPAYVGFQGYSAALIADRFSLSGAFEFTKTSKKVGIKPLIGSTFELSDGGDIVLVARNRMGFRSLCRLISECHLNEPRGYPLLTWERLEKHCEGLLYLSAGHAGMINAQIVRGDLAGAHATLDRLIGIFGRDNVFLQIERTYVPWEMSSNKQLLELAVEMRITPVAGGPATHLEPEDFPAQDVLVCVESLCTIEEIEGRKPRRDESQPQIKAPPRRALNAERYVRSVREMQELYRDRPDLLQNTLLVSDRCETKLLPGMSILPKYCADENEALREIVLDGARYRCKDFKPPRRKRLDMEIDRIHRLGFANHFLVAWDMCNWAREHEILFSGRGSVVDSAVAYCLGISRIDGYDHNLHFDRFLPADGSKRPDIDIDFEAARRNDVRNYLTHKYGREHVATVAAFGAYRSRGIVRDVGKVLGIPQPALEYLTKRLHGSVTPEKLKEAIHSKPELRDSGISTERFEWVFRLGDQLADVPINIRSHSSGVVIANEPIRDICPVQLSADEDVRILQWDKRSAKYAFDKFDVLCLRGNDVLSGTQSRLRKTDLDFDVEKLPLDDPETYRTMRSGQLIGIPQSASPAMRQAHIRLKTDNLKDASLVQAGIRPGVGGAVKMNELIARRRGKPYSFNHPQLAKILEATYGIIVFQEQVDQLLQTFGGYTSGEAETIREGIHKKRRENYVRSIQDDVIERIMGNGYTQQIAQEVYDLVAVFQGYGFAEGHALAFAEVSIRSVWCQQNFPAPYFASLLDAQPAGYYGPCTIANEARVRGVQILGPDVNRSTLQFKTESVLAHQDPDLHVPDGGIRVSLKQISGISDQMRERMMEARESGPYESFFDFVARVRPHRDELECLILCGVFDSLEPNRRRLLWAIPSAQEYASVCGLSPSSLPLTLPEPPLPAGIRDFTTVEKAIRERAILGMDIKHHLMAFERERIQAKGGIASAEAGRMPAGTKIIVVGNPIRLRFPPTSSGKRVMFFDLEDETGLLNVTCFDDTYQRDGHTIICSPYVTLRGVAQDRDGHIAFLAHRAYPYQPNLHVELSHAQPMPIVVADFLVG